MFIAFLIALLSLVALQSWRLWRRGRLLGASDTALAEATRDLFSANQQLQSANRRLQEADAARTDIFSNVSHELRTPMTAIKGYIDNMLDGITGGVNDQQTRYLTRIKTNADRLTRLINDLLDLSRIDRGRQDLLQINIGHLPVTEVVRDAVESLRPVAEDLDIALTFDGPELYAKADRDRLCQIVANLVHNAARFTASGGEIAVSVKQDGTRYVQIIVQDTGRGMTPEEQERIFDRFYQAGAEGTGQSGTGLGLPITKALVNLQGGDIWVRSQVGIGSTFIFTLPQAELPADVSTAPQGDRNLYQESGA
jgi:two-component system, sensor histidine kinase and response regulator